MLGSRVNASRLRALVVDTLPVWHQAFESRVNNTIEQVSVYCASKLVAICSIAVMSSALQEIWLDGLFSAASALRLPVRVDQATPSDHLASAEFGWLATGAARCGDDMDGGDTWTQASREQNLLGVVDDRSG